MENFYFTFNNSGHFGKSRVPFDDPGNLGDAWFTFNHPCNLSNAWFTFDDPGNLGQTWFSLDDSCHLGNTGRSLNNTCNFSNRGLYNSGHFGDFGNCKGIRVSDKNMTFNALMHAVMMITNTQYLWWFSLKKNKK